MEDNLLKKKKFALNQPKQNSLKLYKALKSHTDTYTDAYRKYDAATFEGNGENPKAPSSYASFISLRECKSNPNNKKHPHRISGKIGNDSSLKNPSDISPSLEGLSSKLQPTDVDEDFEFLPVRSISNSDTKSLFPEKSVIEVNLRYECFDLKCNSSLSFLNFSKALPTSEFDVSNSFAPCLDLTEKYFEKVRPLNSNIHSLPTLKYNPDIDFPPDFKEMTEIEISLLQRMACGCKSLSWNEFEKMYLIQEKSEIKTLENAPQNISDPLNSSKTFSQKSHKRKFDIRDSKFYRHKNSSANYAPNLKNKRNGSIDTFDNKKQKVEEVDNDPLLIPYNSSREMIDIEDVNYVSIDHEDIVTVEEDIPQEIFGVPKSTVDHIGMRLKQFRFDSELRTVSQAPQLDASSQEPQVLSVFLEPQFTKSQGPQINTNSQEPQFSNSHEPQQFNTSLQEPQFTTDSQEKSNLEPVSCIFNKKGQLLPLSGGKENLTFSTALRNFLKTKCSPLDSTPSSNLSNSSHSSECVIVKDSNLTEERDILSRAISTINESVPTGAGGALVEGTVNPIITDVTSFASTKASDKSVESSDDIEILGEAGPSFEKSLSKPETKIFIISKWVPSGKSLSNEGASGKSLSNEGASGKSLSNEGASEKSLSNEGASVNPLPCIIPNEKSLPIATSNGESLPSGSSIENSLPNDTPRQTNVPFPTPPGNAVPPIPIIQFIADENDSCEFHHAPPKPCSTPVRIPKPNIQLKRINIDVSSFHLGQRNSTPFHGSSETAQSSNCGREIASTRTPVSTSPLLTSHHNFNQNRSPADKPRVVTTELFKGNFKPKDNFVSLNSTPSKTVSFLSMPLATGAREESISNSPRGATPQHGFLPSSSSVGEMNKETENLGTKNQDLTELRRFRVTNIPGT